jgi:hypothetical protein
MFRKKQTAILLRPHPRPLGSKIFISYRRADTKHVAGRIFDHLKARFGENDIFFDVDAIPIGVNFENYIREAIGSSAAVLALIGRQWVNRSWSRENHWFGGRSAEDHVRAEIELALDYGVPVIPILVDDTQMPDRSELPMSMQEFVKLNAAPMRSGRDFDSDMSVLLIRIEPLRQEASGE